MVRIFDDDLQILRCNGVFVSPRVVITAGECVLAIETSQFPDGVRLPPQSQPNLVIQAVFDNGSFVRIGRSVDSVYHFHGPSAGWNVGMLSIEFFSWAGWFQDSMKWYPTLQSSVVSQRTRA